MDSKGGFYITQIKQLQDRIFERLLLQNGIEISGGQGRILYILWRRDGRSIREISQETSLAQNTVSIIVDGMVKKGILQRDMNPHNRRQTIITLTHYARSIQERYEAVSLEMTSLFYEGFTEQEQVLFESYLARILQTLTELEKSGGNVHEDKGTDL